MVLGKARAEGGGVWLSRAAGGHGREQLRWSRRRRPPPPEREERVAGEKPSPLGAADASADRAGGRDSWAGPEVGQVWGPTPPPFPFPSPPMWE